MGLCSFVRVLAAVLHQNVHLLNFQNDPALSRNMHSILMGEHEST